LVSQCEGQEFDPPRLHQFLPMRYQSVRPALLMDSLCLKPALSQLCHSEVEHGFNPHPWRALAGTDSTQGVTYVFSTLLKSQGGLPVGWRPSASGRSG